MTYYRYPLYRYPYSINRMPNTKNYNVNQVSNASYQKEPLNNEKEKKLQDSRIDSSRGDENTLFEIFGIKLHFDDILLICLIFFLYNEGVQDQYLFIALVLLLLS